MLEIAPEFLLQVQGVAAFFPCYREQRKNSGNSGKIFRC
jgi:hypothetical protein